MMAKAKVYIILVNYKGWKDTQECLESLLKLDYPNYQIVVVDNDSPDQSLAHLLRWARGEEAAVPASAELAHLSTPPCPKPVDHLLHRKEGPPARPASGAGAAAAPLVFLPSGHNGGFAYGNNLGIEFALSRGDADYLWLLNNDTVVEPAALSELLAKALAYRERGQKVGLIGAKLMYYHAPDRIQAVGGIYNKWRATSTHLGAFEKDQGQFDSEHVARAMSYPVGASLFVDALFIDEVGPMCEDYFLYFEEIDWTLRGRRKGWELGYCWSSRVYHKEGGSIGSKLSDSTKSLVAEHYGLRNRLLFSQRFTPRIAPLVRLGFLLAALNRIRKLKLGSALKVLTLMLSPARPGRDFAPPAPRGKNGSSGGSGKSGKSPLKLPAP